MCILKKNKHRGRLGRVVCLFLLAACCYLAAMAWTVGLVVVLSIDDAMAVVWPHICLHA